MNNSRKQSNKLNISVITTRLVDLILKMSAKERQTLLNELEEKYKKGNREFSRKDYKKEVDFVLNERMFRGLIQNLSASGMFIETSDSFSEGQRITLTFQLPEPGAHIKVSGKIVRLIPDIGFGVKFNKVIAVSPQKTKKEEKTLYW
ncbi:MAG: PilZ domain-containing protein [Desulfobacterales bacterium]|nr:PilZ domain-containing protein [Desulfobacterales bacterium]MDX2509106.1 PilZ domain-containing protein [Desulfobacterales bacterium]